MVTLKVIFIKVDLEGFYVIFCMYLKCDVNIGPTQRSSMMSFAFFPSILNKFLFFFHIIVKSSHLNTFLPPPGCSHEPSRFKFSLTNCFNKARSPVKAKHSFSVNIAAFIWFNINQRTNLTNQLFNWNTYKNEYHSWIQPNSSYVNILKAKLHYGSLRPYRTQSRFLWLIP